MTGASNGQINDASAPFAINGVTTINGETGNITLTSTGNTIAITTPTGSTINLETSGKPGIATFVQAFFLT